MSSLAHRSEHVATVTIDGVSPLELRDVLAILHSALCPGWQCPLFLVIQRKMVGRIDRDRNVRARVMPCANPLLWNAMARR
jgi:hypothetical protein